MKLIKASLIFAALAMTTAFASAHAVSQKPSRIVSLDRGADELLILLADRKNIAALTWLATAPDVSNVCKEAKGIPTTHCTAEELAMLKPDLVVTGDHLNPALTTMFSRLKIPCLRVAMPESFDDLRHQIREISHALGEDARGTALLREMDERLRRVAEKRVAIKKKPLVALYFQAGYTAGKGTFANAMIEAAGGENLAAKLGLKGYAQMPMEALVMARPQYLLLTDYLLDSSTLGQEMLAHPALRGLVPAEYTIVMPARLMSCLSPYALDAVEKLAEAMR